MNFKEALIAHKYAHVFRWVADGEEVEYWDVLGRRWDLLSNNTVVLCNAYLGMDFDFRLAPRTITVNGVEVPAPESVAPNDGRLYFIAAPHVDLWAFASKWSNGPADKDWLDRGLVYLDQEDAIARAKAMLLHE